MTAEQILYRLLTKHFDSDLEWNYIEGTRIEDVDADLANSCKEFLEKYRDESSAGESL